MRCFRYPLSGTWRRRGRAHGETFAGEIRSLAELRLHLCRVVGDFRSDEQVLALARDHLPVLEAYSQDRYDELCGIADGASCSAEEIVVLNHYTDLRDLGRSGISGDAGGFSGDGGDGVIGADGCTVIYAETPSGPVLAQTWDMHASATPFVIALEVPSIDGAPAQTLLSLTGCLGMAGVSSTGVAIAINNLHSLDAQVGVVWSALVRQTLAASDAQAARDHVLTAPVGSGHHYVVADASQAFGIETSGSLRVVLYRSRNDGNGGGQGQRSGELYIHTNHCLEDRVAKVSRVPNGSTTYDRLSVAQREADEAPIQSAEDAFVRLGSETGYPRSVCTNMATPATPHAAATCGALSIDLRRKRMLACAGFPHAAQPTVFEVGNG